ncbi:hypothetical protein Tco_0400580, partial [Tanacetum coccineum]
EDTKIKLECGDGYVRKGQKSSQNGQNRAWNGKSVKKSKSKVYKVKVKDEADIEEILNGSTRTHLMDKKIKGCDHRAWRTLKMDDYDDFWALSQRKRTLSNVSVKKRNGKTKT